MSSTQVLAGLGTAVQQDRFLRIPGQLRMRQAVLVALSLLVALIGYGVYRSHAAVVQTVGKDAAPSIVAAENIRSTLGNAHTQIVNAFLTKEDASGESVRAYKQSLATANDHLVTAAQNITYGDDERRPILDILNQVSEYDTLIGMALAGQDSIKQLGQADDLMRERIVPAAAALAQANFTHLDAAYSEGRHVARLWLYGFLAASVVLLLALLDTQRYVSLRFRRLVNPAMAAGCAVFALSVVLFAVKAGGVMSAMRTAKEDAFDSVYALSQAQALAYAANAQESVYLLMQGKDAQARQTALFQEDAKKLFTPDITDAKQLPADLKSLKGRGLLGDELANITFDGEEALARSTVAGWLDYVRIDAQIRALEASGRHQDAVALCLGTQPMQSDWAFETFAKALRGTMDINQAQFDQSIERALHNVRWLWMLLIPTLLCPLLGAVVGIQRRLAEFRA